MSEDVRPCPHCWPRGRDVAPLAEWRCHTRSVGKTPTRDSLRYRWGRYPDHDASGLYQHGPEDSLVSLYGMMTDVIAHEAIALDAEYGQRLRQWQAKDARHNVVQFLALSPHLWSYVKLSMDLAGTPPARRVEIRRWLKEAKEMRSRMIETSKREVARLLAR